jgi:hypothetical protein
VPPGLAGPCYTHAGTGTGTGSGIDIDLTPRKRILHIYIQYIYMLHLQYSPVLYSPGLAGRPSTVYQHPLWDRSHRCPVRGAVHDQIPPVQHPRGRCHLPVRQAWLGALSDPSCPVRRLPSTSAPIVGGTAGHCPLTNLMPAVFWSIETTRRPQPEPRARAASKQTRDPACCCR